MTLYLGEIQYLGIFSSLIFTNGVDVRNSKIAIRSGSFSVILALLKGFSLRVRCFHSLTHCLRSLPKQHSLMKLSPIFVVLNWSISK